MTVDEVLTSLLETGNKKHMVSFAYGDCFTKNGDYRVSLNTERSRSSEEYVTRDGNWFKPHPRWDIECFYCHRKGHIKRYYKEILKAIKNLDEKKKQGTEWAKVVEICDIKNDIICMITSDGSRDNWNLISHVCKQGVVLINTNLVMLVMVNGLKSKVVDMGTMKVKMLDEVVQTLGDVRNVPSLKKNLVSLSNLYKLGYDFFQGTGL